MKLLTIFRISSPLNFGAPGHQHTPLNLLKATSEFVVSAASSRLSRVIRFHRKPTRSAIFVVLGWRNSPPPALACRVDSNHFRFELGFKFSKKIKLKIHFIGFLGAWIRLN